VPPRDERQGHGSSTCAEEVRAGCLEIDQATATSPKPFTQLFSAHGETGERGSRRGARPTFRERPGDSPYADGTGRCREAAMAWIRSPQGLVRSGAATGIDGFRRKDNRYLGTWSVLIVSSVDCVGRIDRPDSDSAAKMLEEQRDVWN